MRPHPTQSLASRTVPRGPRSIPRSLAALALVLALGGCAKMDVRLALDGDTVSGTMIMGIDKQVAERSGRSQEELLEGLTRYVPEGATVEPFSDDRFIGTRATLRDVPLARLNADAIRVTHDKDAGTYTVSGALDLTSLPAGSNPDVRLSIDFPGTVIRHNGDLTGTTVTWVGAAGKRAQIEAVAKDAGGSGFSAPLIALAIGVPLLLVLVGVLLWMVRRGGPAEISREEDRVLS